MTAFPELSRAQIEELLLAQNARVTDLQKKLTRALTYVERAANAAPSGTLRQRSAARDAADRDAAAIRAALQDA